MVVIDTGTPSTAVLAHEGVTVHRGRNSGLPLIVAVHSTVLGPAVGGCRLARWAVELRHETPSRARERVGAIAGTLTEVLSLARESGGTPAEAAARLVRRRLAADPTRCR